MRSARLPHRVFLVSPASFRGERSRTLMRPDADHELARRVRETSGAPLGEVFGFLSSLYFPGKLAYATSFSRPPLGAPGVLVITPGAGLRRPDEPVNLETLRRFAEIDVSPQETLHLEALRRDARTLHATLQNDTDVVLLGSVASGKYLQPLVSVLGERLLFPAEFVGRSDLARGSLLLRRVAERRELEYVCHQAVRHGPRPPRQESGPIGVRVAPMSEANSPLPGSPLTDWRLDAGTRDAQAGQARPS